MSSVMVVGFDLGTTNSSISVYRNKCVEIIPDKEGNKIISSYVAFTKNGRIVGNKAKDQATFEPKNTIFGVKRLIGRKFLDKEVQADMKKWPFDVISEQLKPKIRVNFLGEQHTYFPEEISSMVLGELKEAAEDYLKSKVTKCVITVPAYFNDSQRQATIDAGKIAGLDVMKIINEPTAAAVAYGFDKKSKSEQHILVYDLGGGTFDVSILKIHGTHMEVLSTGGNTYLGGEDFDNNVMDYVIDEFEKQNKVDIRDNKRALRRIRTACEKAKIQISNANETEIEIVSLISEEDDALGNTDMNIKLTREKFEELNNNLFMSTLETITECLKDAKLEKSKINEIVLIGGSSRIPKVRSMVQDFFDGKELNSTINPDEAVACGAAIAAALQHDRKAKGIEEVIFYDIATVSFGIKMALDRMDIIIPKNSTVPLKQIKKYHTVKDDQEKITVTILEGESEMCKDNKIIGTFTIENLPKKPAGQVEVNITFEIDNNGILTVNCEETTSLINNGIKITHEKGSLSDQDLQRMIIENKKAREMEELRTALTSEKNKIYDFCNNMSHEVREKTQKESLINIITTMCNETSDWVDTYPDLTIEDYQKKYNEVKTFYDTNMENL